MWALNQIHELLYVLFCSKVEIIFLPLAELSTLENRDLK